jgi:hypothetical protein
MVRRLHGHENTLVIWVNDKYAEKVHFISNDVYSDNKRSRFSLPLWMNYRSVNQYYYKHIYFIRDLPKNFPNMSLSKLNLGKQVNRMSERNLNISTIKNVLEKNNSKYHIQAGFRGGLSDDLGQLIPNGRKFIMSVARSSAMGKTLGYDVSDLIAKYTYIN